jgi:hypothetical protein
MSRTFAVRAVDQIGLVVELDIDARTEQEARAQAESKGLRFVTICRETPGRDTSAGDRPEGWSIGPHRQAG